MFFRERMSPQKNTYHLTPNTQNLSHKNRLPNAKHCCGFDSVEFAQHTDGGAVLVGNAAQSVTRLDFVGFVLRLGKRLLIGQAVVRVDAEIVLFDSIERIAQSACLEIDKSLWVKRLAVIANLEMQMRARATARVAALADNLARFHNLTHLHITCRQVRIVGFKSVGVAQNNQVSVSARALRVFRHTHLAVESGAHWVANLKFDVGAVVVASFAETVSRCDAACDWRTE